MRERTAAIPGCPRAEDFARTPQCGQTSALGVYVAAAVLTVLPRSACRRADRMSLCGGLRLGSLPLGRGWPPAESGPLRIAPLTKGSARTGRGWYATMGT